jgi:hypothetical protein
MFCGFGSLVSEHADAVKVKQTHCRRWTCPVCGPIRRMQCEIEIRAGQPDACLTLTMKPIPGRTPLQARKKLAEAFPKLVRWLRRQTGTKLSVYAVCEKHKSGYPHLHVALRGWRFVPHARIKAKWLELTGSFVVWIDAKGTPQQLARYLAKYLSKDLAKFGDYKRYWHSQDWVLGTGDQSPAAWRGDVWRHTADNVDEVLRVLTREGWHFEPHAGRDGLRVAFRAPWWKPGEDHMPPQYAATGRQMATGPPDDIRKAA